MNPHDPTKCVICLSGLEHTEHWKDQQSGKIPEAKEPTCEELCSEARKSEREECAALAERLGDIKVSESIRARSSF